MMHLIPVRSGAFISTSPWEIRNDFQATSALLNLSYYASHGWIATSLCPIGLFEGLCRMWQFDYEAVRRQIAETLAGPHFSPHYLSFSHFSELCKMSQLRPVDVSTLIPYMDSITSHIVSVVPLSISVVPLEAVLHSHYYYHC